MTTDSTGRAFGKPSFENLNVFGGDGVGEFGRDSSEP